MYSAYKLNEEVTVYSFDVLLSQFECIYMESRKMVLINLFSEQEWRSRQREQTYGHMDREEGEGKIYGESNMEAYNTICKIANRNLLYDSGNSNKGSLTV